MIEYIIAFIVLWIISFCMHEFGHVLGALLSGGNAKIKIWKYKKLPSMMTVPYGTINRTRFLFMGGFSAFILYGILFLLSESSALRYSFFTIGSIQLVYAFYETLLKDKLTLDDYMKYHYVLYGIVWFITASIYVLLVPEL